MTRTSLPQVAPRVERQPARTEDQIVFVVLVLTLLFLVFMMSVPLWLSAFVRGLVG